MKTISIMTMVLAASISIAAADEKKNDKTTGEKAKEALEKAGEKTKDAGRAIVGGTKKAANAILDAVTPDADARKVDVKLEGRDINMPRKLAAGKTAFVVHNAGKDKHNFKIRGEGVDKKFLTNLDPDETKVLHVDLKPGTYQITCPFKEHDTEGMKLSVTVE